MQVTKYTRIMIGTGIDGYITLGGGSGSGLQSVKVTILADAGFLQVAELAGATEIIATISDGNVKNKVFDFTSHTGRLNNYQVYAGEIHTIFFKKP